VFKTVIEYSLLISLLIPLLFVPVVLLFKNQGKNLGYITTIPLVVSVLLLTSAALNLRTMPAVSELYSWAKTAGLDMGLLADGLSIWVLLTISILGVFVALYSIPYVEQRIQEMESNGDEIGKGAYSQYYALYLLYIIGMLGCVLSTNLIEFYFFYELMLVPSWLLVNNFGYGNREHIGMIYFIWTHVGAVIMLAGILASYTVTGSFEIKDLVNVVGSSYAGWIVIAILIGFFTKMASFGIHMWQPPTYSQSPISVTALLSPAMAGIGAYAAIRIVVIPMFPVFKTFAGVFSIWALVTLVYGGLMAFTQDDINRFLAYSSISQMGYIFLGIASAASLGEVGAIFHYVSHGFGKCILFLVAGLILHQTGTRSIKELSGLADRMPITATVTLIGLFTIGGVPPTIGFWSKFMIFTGVFNGALVGNEQLIVAVAGIIMTVLTIGYGTWILRRIFFGPLSENLKNVKEAPMLMLLPIALLAFISLIVGVWPSLVTEYLIPFFQSSI
jgi:NADH-quinone oxidoreductase subunit M